MKSHLRPPFTLNMGHYSCPDLGFDPQRYLTPTIPPRGTILPSGEHACICIHTCTHPQIHMHVTQADSYTHAHNAFPGFMLLDSVSGGVC